MNLSPIIIIPTYWSGRRSVGSVNRGFPYDHMTPIDKDGELPRLLASLRRVTGINSVRIALLVVAEPGVENQASEKVRAIADSFPDLNTIVVAEPELRHVHRYMEQLGSGDFTETASLTGYGPIRNMGLLVASIFCHDVVIFLDDDVIINTPDFLERAVYGIACKTPNGAIITAKTGFFFNENGEFTAPAKPWYDRFWNYNQAFNQYIGTTLESARLTIANVCCGGCMVLHADTYGSLAFDPWIGRGEDLDYLLSARMYGKDIWFDNNLSVTHVPPAAESDMARFTSDVRRWFYENRKIEYAKTQIDLLQVTPANLEPYPAPWLDKSIGRKARITALLRIIGAKEHGEYFNIFRNEIKSAGEYARDNCANYFEFQHQWPTIVRSLWNCTPLATQLSGARAVQSGNPSFTGRFAAVSVNDSTTPRQ